MFKPMIDNVFVLGPYAFNQRKISYPAHYCSIFNIPGSLSKLQGES